jgi:hypothetical protein
LSFHVAGFAHAEAKCVKEKQVVSIIRRALNRPVAEPALRFLLKHKDFSVAGFYEYEDCGVHILPVYYYSPIPASRSLNARKAEWNRERAFTGVDFRLAEQLALWPKLLEYAVECHHLFPYAEIAAMGYDTAPATVRPKRPPSTR